jgi:hypothetical protein
MGRPISIQPDETVLWDLAYLGCCDRHIASVIGCHQSLISKRPDIRAVLTKARAERADAIAKLWGQSSAGALRAEDRAGCLTELVAAAERRAIRRRSGTFRTG